MNFSFNSFFSQVLVCLVVLESMGLHTPTVSTFSMKLSKMLLFVEHLRTRRLMPNKFVSSICKTLRCVSWCWIFFALSLQHERISPLPGSPIAKQLPTSAQLHLSPCPLRMMALVHCTAYFTLSWLSLSLRLSWFSTV